MQRMFDLMKTRVTLVCVTVSVLAAACAPLPTQQTQPTAPAAPAATDAAPTDAAKPAEATSTTGFPVTIQHKYGSTTIDAEPKRVVSVGYRDHEHLLALGVVPLGVRDWYGNGYDTIFWPWAKDALGDAKPEIIGKFDSVNLEAVAALKPDLITGVYSGMSESEYKKLSQIAPTLMQSGDYVDYGMPWQEETRMIGRALGKADLAEKLVTDVQAQFAKARAEHSEFAGKTLVAAQLDAPGKYWVLSPKDHKARFFTAFGFTIPDEVAKVVGEQSNIQISEERLDLLDRDVLVWLKGSDLGWADGSKMADEVKANPIYRKLKVVQDGRDVFAELPADALAWSTLLSLPYAIEGFVPLLKQAVGGRE